MQSIHTLMALLIMTTVMTACTKKAAQETQYFYGRVEVLGAALPATPDMDIYIEDDSIGLLTPGRSVVETAQTADKKKVSVYIAGTKTLIADTLIQLYKDSTVSVKVGYSEPLGISGFLGQGTAVHPDSCTFKLYNQMNTELQPEGVEVDAILYVQDDNGEFVETGDVWENFTRNKLHAKVVTVKADGSFRLKFKNKATGEYLKELAFNRDFTFVYFDAGKYLIISIGTKYQRQKPVFDVVSSEL